jgi:hypothetical protein
MNKPDPPVAKVPDTRGSNRGGNGPPIWRTVPATTVVYERIMRLDACRGAGACFTLEIPTREMQYLVTAAHLVPPAEDDPAHLVMKKFGGVWEGSFKRIPIDVAPEADVAVFPIGWPPTTQTLPVFPSTDGLMLAQDAYIFGYPHRVGGTRIRGVEAFAFVKKATISAFAEPNDVRSIFLDGHSNEGFSGSPVVFGKPGQPYPCIAGVVIGSVFDEEIQTHHPKPPKWLEKLTIAANAGIILATEIGHVVEAMGFHSEETFGPFEDGWVHR